MILFYFLVFNDSHVNIIDFCLGKYWWMERENQKEREERSWMKPDEKV